CQQHNGYPFTF
nr:immunoglobulin light chain junction region [Macaca mulatta]MOW42352.1 immunoglobulin light chain junction region [Macaca mulatta]MOW42631.1 immunoglobulin light chain junction region [Macaca mulatta]MOW42720.1 immunoglobulin light chain junction region [Macaca mulatta]MOW45089.1 immunoglobulin light chain junction region [Macaca mulatta]